MEHLYIEKKADRLYGVYHEPVAFENENYGVVLCYPFGQEYIRCHKLYVNMANRFAEEGFHTLRFDYSGTGDSSGCLSEINSLSNNVDDIEFAIKELKEACGIKKILLVGVRFGATLSMLYARQNKIDGLIIWNPVMSGKEYLKNISLNYKNWLAGSFAKEKKLKNDDIEIFGFLFNSFLKKEIETTLLTNKDFETEYPILIIDDDKNELGELKNVSFDLSVNKEFWIKRETEEGKSMVPNHELNRIINWAKDKL